MAEPEILFEVNASQILAKLHLAGLQPCTYDRNKEFIINTGIKNDNPNAKPENPGNVEFDLGNAQGEYEIGFVTEAKYQGTQGLNSIIQQFNEMVAKLNVKPRKEEDEKGLLDKEEKRNKNDENKNKDFKQFFIDVQKLFDDNKEILQVAKFDYVKFIDQFLKYVNEKKDDSAKVKSMNDLSNNEFLEFVDKMRESLSAANEEYEKNNSGKTESHAAERAEAIKQLTTYLRVFVGEDKAKSFNEKDLVEIQISEKPKDSNDSSLVKNYEIVPASDQEIETIKQKNEADPKKAYERICFKTGYTIQIEK